MKTILVDAVNALIIKEEGIFEEMYNLLEKYPNRKIVLTGANEEEQKKFGFEDVPYEFFTLSHNPEKSDPEYYRKMLEKFSLNVEDVIYFEHNEDAVKSAESVGIKTYHYVKDKRDIEALENFLSNNL